MNLEEVNRMLLEQYGRKFDRPRFRVVFSDHEFEKRWTDFSPEGFQLVNPRVMELPKYGYAQGVHILEMLFEVGEVNPELVEPLSYEPIWFFWEPESRKILPLNYEVCQIVINQVMKQAAEAVGHTFPKSKKYADPLAAESDPKIAVEARTARLDSLQEQLFGNETPVGDALAHKYGVTVPGFDGKVN